MRGRNGVKFQETRSKVSEISNGVVVKNIVPLLKKLCCYKTRNDVRCSERNYFI